MAAVGGPIESVTIDGRNFPIDAEAASERDLGGFSNEIKPNGDGTFRQVKSRKVAGANALTLVVDDDRADQEFLQERANSSSFFDYDITYVSGTVYSGQGQIEGDIKYDSKEAICEIELKGSLGQQ